MTSSFKDDQDTSSSSSTYLTPTQRKNQELKRIRLELDRANNMLLSKDKEIMVLKKEIAALKARSKMIVEKNDYLNSLISFIEFTARD